MLNWLVITSLETSFVIGLVLLSRAPLRRLFGANVAYALWLIPVIGVLLPSRPVRPTIPIKAIPLPGVDIPGDIYSAAQTWAVPSGLPWEWLWLLGMGAVLALQLIAALRFNETIRATAVPFVVPAHLLEVLSRHAARHPRVFTTTLGGAPFVSGLINASVFLPTDFLERFSAREQRWIVTHELMHLSRGDLWVRLAAEVFRALFWFNPLVHLAIRTLRQDQEYACDQAVVSRCTPQERYEYGKALMLGASPSGEFSFLTFFGNSKERFVMLGKHRKSAVRTFLGAVVCVVIGVYALVSAPLLTAEDAATSGYDMKSVVQIQGGVFWFRWPGEGEATLGVMVPDQTGKAQEWTVVLVPTSELREGGFDRTLVGPGSAVIVTGHPSLAAGEHRLLAATVMRPDGTGWSR